MTKICPEAKIFIVLKKTIFMFGGFVIIIPMIKPISLSAFMSFVIWRLVSFFRHFFQQEIPSRKILTVVIRTSNLLFHLTFEFCFVLNFKDLTRNSFVATAIFFKLFSPKKKKNFAVTFRFLNTFKFLKTAPRHLTQLLNCNGQTLS